MLTANITFSPEAEEWFEFGPPDDRRRVGFHDYAAIYAEPGLYEAVFTDVLGMCSARLVPELWAEAHGGDLAGERVLELGAGTGLAGARLRELGVGHLVGVDLEPMARVAAERDRPSVYDAYLVGDIAGDELQAELAPQGFTAMLAVAAVGAGHVPPEVLRAAVELVVPGGLFGFAVTPPLLPGSTDPEGIDSGYPALLEELFAPEVARHEYLHRRSADGTPHDAVALIGRRPA